MNCTRSFPLCTNHRHCLVLASDILVGDILRKDFYVHLRPKWFQLMIVENDQSPGQ